MTTKKEMIEIIKAENLNGLRIGDDDSGYTDLSAAETEAQIAEWAANRLRCTDRNRNILVCLRFVFRWHEFMTRSRPHGIQNSRVLDPVRNQDVGDKFLSKGFEWVLGLSLDILGQTY